MRSLNDRLSLQTKLIAVMVILGAGAMVLSGVAGLVVLEKYLVRQVDSQLSESVEELALEWSDTQPGGGTTETESGQSRRSGPDAEGGGRERQGLTMAFYSCVLDSEGNPISEAQLRLPYGDDLEAPDLPLINAATAGKLGSHPFTVTGTDDDQPWRVLVEETDDGDIAVVAFSLDQITHTVRRLALAEALFGLGMLVVLVGLGYFTIRSSLRPLMRVEATAEAIAAGDLSQRIPVNGSRTEVGRLSLSLNAMLGQIETAFRDREESARRAQESADFASASEATARASEERMRRFVADAGHELRTPLTSIRGFAELLRRQITSDPEMIGGTVRRIQAASERMTTLVEDLLLLARLDQRRPLRHDPVDILELAVDVLSEFRITNPEHPVDLLADVSEPAVVSGDEIRLRQVITNLLANAGTHTPPGTQVTVGVVTNEEMVELTVADEGPGLAAKDVGRVFERFYRVDQSRTRASGGTGLGLAIVASLVEAHGGTAEVESAEGMGARFVIRLPLSRAAVSPAVSQSPAQLAEATGEQT